MFSYDFKYIFFLRYSCIQCGNNQYKNFDYKICSECPQGAFCEDGLIYNLEGVFFYLLMIFEKKFTGFWKESNTSIKLYKCFPYASACLEVYTNMATICEKGYQGPLCQTCQKNYAKVGETTCQKCYSKSINLILIILIITALSLVLMIYIR